MAATDEVGFDGDKVITFRLKHPFPLLPDALAKPMAFLCPMMPERLASTDPFKAITDMTGSGPYKYNAAERVAGSRLVYDRFTDYVPRETGAIETTAGPKRPVFDRVEWSIIPDNATAVAALQRGEIDWLQTPGPDLLGVLRKDSKITVRTIAPTGLVAFMRFNQLLPLLRQPRPASRLARRRHPIGLHGRRERGGQIALARWRRLFLPRHPARLLRRHGASDRQARLRQGAQGHRGQRLQGREDRPDGGRGRALLSAEADGRCDRRRVRRKWAWTVDYQAIDWTTLVQRRIKMDPIDQGGWNLFVINDNGINEVNPAGHLWLRGNGKGRPAPALVQQRWHRGAAQRLAPGARS